MQIVRIYFFCSLIAFFPYVLVQSVQAESEGLKVHSTTDALEEEGTPAPLSDLLVKGVPFTAPLKEVPQSTSVVTPTFLENRGSTSFQDMIDYIPGLSFSGGTSRPRFFLIRGVGELEQYEGAPNPSVATIIDDIDFSGLGIVTPLFDIDQIEVLRGPQGTRFGSSALGGAINVRSKDPTPYTSGSVQLMGGNDDLRSGAAAVSGVVPGTDERLLLRFSAISSKSDGFRDNTFLGRDDTNQRDENLARLKARYIGEEFTLDVAGWMVRNNNGYDVFAIDNSLTTQSDRPGRDDTSADAGSVKFESQLSDQISLTNITSLMRTRIGYAFDGDWGNNPFWAPHDPYDFFSDTDRTRRMVSNETRVTSNDQMYVHGEDVRWLGGVFLQRLTEESVTTQSANDEPYDSLITDYRANTFAGFGQYEVPLGNATAVTFGGRVEHRRTGYDDSRQADFSPSFTMIGGSLGVTHDLSESLRGYLSVSRGYKGGGFNAGVRVPTERRQYDPEYLYNVELGTKGSWFDKRLVSNVALFLDQRRDQQLKLAVQDDPSDPLAFTFITESSARGRSYGIEVENSFKVLPPVEIFLNGAMLKSEFTSVPDELSALEGRSYSHAPSWQYSTGVQATLGAGFFIRSDVTGKNSFFFDDSHNQRGNPYSIVNASLGWRREGWRVIAWGRNLGNEGYAVRGFFFGNEPPDFPSKQYIQRGDPRAFGLTVGYDF
jgi:outer membrane receptor protein involved in Fe transport